MFLKLDALTCESSHYSRVNVLCASSCRRGSCIVPTPPARHPSHPYESPWLRPARRTLEMQPHRPRRGKAG